MGKTSGSNRTLDGPAVGRVTRGKAGSRALDGPGIGKAPNAGDHKNLPTNCHACGKPHASMGGDEKQSYSNPKPKCYAQGPQGKHSGGF